jgi:uncharacterized protein YjiS (DUF1127 family)
MAFGIHSKFATTSARAVLLGIALGASRHAWRRLRAWITPGEQADPLTGLGDWLLRDVGVIRERDIGVSSETARREVDRLFWGP